jgi:hypothetical protein
MRALYSLSYESCTTIPMQLINHLVIKHLTISEDALGVGGLIYRVQCGGALKAHKCFEFLPGVPGNPACA